MRTRIAVITGVIALLVLAGAGGVYAYDKANAETIAKGVRVGGVEVGGLTPAEARTKLRSSVLDPLSRPVKVRAHGKRFRLTAERAELAVDVDGSVRAALDRSREGSILERAWRGIRGESVAADIELDIGYSERAIDRLVERVGEAVDEPAVDASVDLASGDVTPKPSKQGRRLRAKRLERELHERLVDVGAARTVRARTQVVEPEVTTDELAEKYPTIIVVDRGAFKLTLYKDLEPVKTYGIAVGAVGLETPAGLYDVQNKAVDPAWTMPYSDWVAPADRGRVIPGGVPENPLKARWLGIYDGAGIHGTDAEGSIGTAASHGCIRMRIPEVIELYDQVEVGAPVYIS